MRAMILAAGLGTRLRPLTNDRPKALVQINGRTLLEITLARLREFGVSEVIVNAHHFADRLIEYLEVNNNFGMRVEISREDVLLDTGGGLKKAAHFFLGDSSGDSEPFILHNVDVLSTIDLHKMLVFHREHDALATLAVQNRKASRYLLFDGNFQLCGRGARRDTAHDRSSQERHARPHPNLELLAFCGIHVISPRLLSEVREEGAFSIIDSYLRLAAAGEKILAFRADHYYWRDLGTAEHISEAAADLASGAVSMA